MNVLFITDFIEKKFYDHTIMKQIVTKSHNFFLIKYEFGTFGTINFRSSSK